jgi:hypothetical protein
MRIDACACLAVACALLSGCTTLTVDQAVDDGNTAANPNQDYSTAELQVLFGQDEGREIQPGSFREDQVVRLRTSRSGSDDADPVKSAEVIVGVVSRVDDEHVHLRDVMLLRGSGSQRGTPVLNKLPNVSRLFVNRGYGVDVTPVPGVLEISRAEITSAAELSLEQLMALSVTALNASTTQLIPSSDDATANTPADVSF